MKKTTIALMLGLALASPVQAEWVKLAEVEYAGVVYFEPGTIKKTRSGYVRVWKLYDLKTPQKSSVGVYSSMKTLEEYDCDEERFRSLTLFTYSQGMGNGELVSSEGNGDDKPAWGYAPPQSIAAAELSVFCQSR